MKKKRDGKGELEEAGFSGGEEGEKKENHFSLSLLGSFSGRRSLRVTNPEFESSFQFFLLLHSPSTTRPKKEIFHFLLPVFTGTFSPCRKP